MPENNRRRVAVTGIGPVTPIGTGLSAFWESILAGRSGAGRLTKFDPSPYSSQISAEVNDFDVDEFIDAKRSRRMARFAQLAYASALFALEDAGLRPSDPDPARVGVIVGSGIGGIGLYEEEHAKFLEKGPRFVSPALVQTMIPNSASGSVAIELGFTGPNDCTVTACAASGHAIARAVDLIRNGAADVMLAGGAEAAITPLAVAAFCSARALSTRNDDPQRASRPFDKDRDGFVVGEGACMLILENMETARARGARIHAEIVGYGMSADAHHLVAPHPEGAGAAAAMISALQDAELTAADIGYINAHATSTSLGDIAEAKAIHKVFGEGPPTSATKSMTGHLLGAAGATEAAATIMALSEQILPPTINYETPDPECDLDVVPNEPRPARVEAALSNSFGFGGHNVSVAFARV